ncbi:MAG: RluA family pseudouridine synthase [Deltaproteobacteria bacterium]|nr:RluA family pseudouridine synthase [Deltaproteobacteria bacterium]
MENTKTFTVSADGAHQRLDVYLAGELSTVSRSAIKRLLEDGRIRVNGKSAKAGYRLRPNDCIDVSLPPEAKGPLEPQAMPLDIIYEDDDIIVLNKPAGLAVHPGAGRESGTLVNALLSHTRTLSDIDPSRPGIVHRLDKDTTGALAIARNNRSHISLAGQFKGHTTKRNYVALVWGSVDGPGAIDLPIGRDLTQRKKISARTKKSRRAVTLYRVLKRYPLMTLLELSPQTGRTHQIRVHLASINHPVVGDQVYGKRKTPSTAPKPVADMLKKIKRQMLHAKTLGLIHPAKGVYMEFSSPLPRDMEGLIKALEEAC